MIGLFSRSGGIILNAFEVASAHVRLNRCASARDGFKEKENGKKQQEERKLLYYV